MNQIDVLRPADIAAGAMGLVLAVVLHFLVSPFLPGGALPPPVEAAKKKWDKVTEVPSGGEWIGLVETVLFFMALAWGAREFVVAWIALKAASKWDTWANIYKVPLNLVGARPADLFVARKHWGARVYQRFLIGTGGNLVSALVGITLARLLAGR